MSETIAKTHIKLGWGQVMIHAGRYDGVPAIFLKNKNEPGIDLVITIENGSERVIIDRILEAVNRFPKIEED